jgi:hypothetical protein
MKRMNDAAPSIIAKDGDRVVGYASDASRIQRRCSGLSFFENINRTVYQNQPLADFM